MKQIIKLDISAEGEAPSYKWLEVELIDNIYHTYHILRKEQGGVITMFYTDMKIIKEVPKPEEV
jgi:hypothetical protein